MRPQFLIVDLFCGAGGTTTGFELTGGISRVIACVNHDPKAIKSHWRNHPHVKHFEEDIRTLELKPLIALTNKTRRQFPEAKVILWASLECTNFSKAKGGKARDADSRTLADHLDRYVDALCPDFIQIENVVEFRSWGPLDANGKPISRKSGKDWLRWRKHLCSFGYVDEWREMNAADYGAFTSRNRLFGIFARNSDEIRWPEPTHAKNPSKGAMFEGLEKWKACRPCLDLDDQGNSIFTVGKIKSEKTFERVLAGCIRFIAGMGYKEFLTKHFSGSPWDKSIAVEGPAGTITYKDHHGIVQAEFLSKCYSGRPEGKNIPVDGPAGTITTFGGSHSLVQSEFLMKQNSTDARTGEPRVGVSIDGPAPVIPTQRIPNLVHTDFLSHYYGTGGQHSSVEEPAPVIPTKARTAKVRAEWLDRQFSGGGQHSDIDQPAGTLLQVPKTNLVQAEPFISDTNFNNTGQSIDQPLGVITANRKWHYLMNPQWSNSGSDLDNPCFTLIARMDKAPPYLVQTENGQVAIEVYETDSPARRKLKYFMAMYGIVDIKMRMLKVNELKKIQGFPENYILEGNQSDQKKFIGNSVVPQVVTAWTLALGNSRLKMVG